MRGDAMTAPITIPQGWNSNRTILFEEFATVTVSRLDVRSDD